MQTLVFDWFYDEKVNLKLVKYAKYQIVQMYTKIIYDSPIFRNGIIE